MASLKHQKAANRKRPTPRTPLQGQLETVRELRALRRTEHLATTRLAYEERRLGQMFADWCEKTPVQP